jgi:glycosyltransferase involved in cell wall biosynthesis
MDRDDDMTMAKIGIIVPVYNVERYLNRCIDSILKQTFEDFEVILIDDGSTDRSGRICDEYAETDARIQAVHKDNSGVADTRNKGLEIVKTEYITFIDADDYVDSRYLETLYRLMKKYDGDLVISYHNVLQENGCRRLKSGNSTDQTVFGEAIVSKAEVYKAMLGNEGMITSVWGKLYHRDLFQTVRYPVGEIYEDMSVISKIVERSRRIVAVSYRGYYYIQRTGSITHGTPSLEHMVLLYNEEQLMHLIQDKYPEIEGIAKRHYFWSCFYLLHLLIAEPKFEPEIKELRDKIRAEWRFLIFGKETSLMERGATVCLMMGLPVYKILVLICRYIGIGNI